MVKEKKHRIEKTLAKYDPLVYTIRIKHLQNLAKKKFAIPASQDYYIDTNIQNWITQFGLDIVLGYGKRAVLMDITRQYIFNWQNMTDTDFQKLHTIWISKGFTEEQYITFLEFMDAKQIEIKQLYYYCHFPRNYLLSSISLVNVKYPVLKSETYIDDLTTFTIEKIFAYPTGNDILKQKPVNQGSAKLDVDVCCHNVVNTIILLLPNPVANWSVHNVNGSLSVPAPQPDVYMRDVNILRTVFYESIFVNIWNLFPSLDEPTITFQTWIVTPLLSYAIVLEFIVQNKSPTISESVSESTTHNIIPLLSVSVAHS